MQDSNFGGKKQPKKVIRIKYKNVAIALVLLILLLVAMVSCTVSIFNKKDDKKDNKTSVTSQVDKDNKNTSNNNGKDKDNKDKDNKDKDNKDKLEKGDGKDKQPAPKPKPTIPPEQVLKNSAFIGDSRMQGLVLYNGLTNIKNYTNVGLNVQTAQTKAFVNTSDGNLITIQQSLSSVGDIERIYLNLGINELGWPSVEGFIGEYKELINMIKQAQPKAKIYVLAILPVTKERSDTDNIFNNAKIKQFNSGIEQMAKDLKINYLDCKSVVIDANGNLVADASTDGIHLTKEYCEKWLQFIKENP